MRSGVLWLGRQGQPPLTGPLGKMTSEPKEREWESQGREEVGGRQGLHMGGPGRGLEGSGRHWAESGEGWTGAGGGELVLVREGLGSVLGINWGPSWRCGKLGWVGQAVETGRGLVQTNRGVVGREGPGASSTAVGGAEQPAGPALKPSIQAGSRSPGGCQGLGKHQAGCLCRG